MIRAEALAFGVAAVCALGGCTQTSPSVSAFEQKRFDLPVKVLNVRKVTGRLLGGNDDAVGSDVLAQTGIAETRLLWRNRWNWNNEEHHRGVSYGLRGGPMVSVGIPTGVGPGAGVSIEARCAALVYALPDDRALPAPDERMRDRDTQTTVEGGLYLSLPFGK